jgi:hypothetical protein
MYILLTDPDAFVMTYAIITGAHFFPYAWYYRSLPYAVMAGVIAAGALILEIVLSPADVHLLPFAMAGALAVLAIWLYQAWRVNARAFSLLLESPSSD